MSTQFAPNSMSLPPPDLDLFDGARLVGWVRGPVVGFRGFANENEAAGAAWIAHRTLARRLARRHAGPLPPVDVEPLSLRRDGDRMVILAGGRPVATLVPPGTDALSGQDSFGFEIQVPPAAADALSMRSLAYRIYRTLRKSGARWAMWERRSVNRRRVSAAAPSADVQWDARLRDNDPSDESMRERGWLALGAVSTTVLALAVVVPDGLAVAFAAIGFAGLVVFRLTAPWVGWLPDRAARVVSSGPAETSVPRSEPTPRAIPWRSNGAMGGPRHHLAGESRNGTSPRLASS